MAVAKELIQILRAVAFEWGGEDSFDVFLIKEGHKKGFWSRKSPRYFGEIWDRLPRCRVADLLALIEVASHWSRGERAGTPRLEEQDLEPACHFILRCLG